MLFCISVKPFLPGIQSCFFVSWVTHQSQDKEVEVGALEEEGRCLRRQILSGWALAQRKFKLDYIRSLGIIQCDLCRCLLPGEMGQNKPSSSQVALTGSCPRAVLLMLEGEQ